MCRSLEPLLLAFRGLYGFAISVCIVNEDPRSDRKLTRKAIERATFGRYRHGGCTIVFKKLLVAI